MPATFTMQPGDIGVKRFVTEIVYLHRILKTLVGASRDLKPYKGYFFGWRVTQNFGS